MSAEFRPLTWSARHLARAIEAVARASDLDVRPAQIPYDSGNASLPNDALDKWIQDNAQWFGLEAEYVDVTYDAVDDMLRQMGPSLLADSGRRRIRIPRSARRREFRICTRARSEHQEGFSKLGSVQTCGVS